MQSLSYKSKSFKKKKDSCKHTGNIFEVKIICCVMEIVKMIVTILTRTHFIQDVYAPIMKDESADERMCTKVLLSR